MKISLTFYSDIPNEEKSNMIEQVKQSFLISGAFVFDSIFVERNEVFLFFTLR